MSGRFGRLWESALLKARQRQRDAGPLFRILRDAATTPLLARKGRASYLGERSVGHQDPGATSTALIVAALSRAVAEG